MILVHAVQCTYITRVKDMQSIALYHYLPGLLLHAFLFAGIEPE